MTFQFDPLTETATLADCETAIASAFPAVPEITASELYVRLAANAPTLLLDVREEAEHAVSHIRGSVVALPGVSAAAVLTTHNPTAGTTIVCVCSVGLRSARMAALLRDAGWVSVANLRGGIFRWALNGRPLETFGRPTTNVHPFDDRWGRLLKIPCKPG